LALRDRDMPSTPIVVRLLLSETNTPLTPRPTPPEHRRRLPPNR
jgi:hypothetical protein